MVIFMALHILLMFTAVTFLMGEALLYALAIQRRDVHALASIHNLIGGRPVIGASLFLAGIVFGLATAATAGIDFFKGWLIAAYVLVAALLLFNGSPPVQRLPQLGREAVEAEAGRRPVEDVVRAMEKSPAPLLAAINAALFVAIIVDMVVKPF